MHIVKLLVIGTIVVGLLLAVSVSACGDDYNDDDDDGGATANSTANGRARNAMDELNSTQANSRRSRRGRSGRRSRNNNNNNNNSRRGFGRGSWGDF